VITAGSNGESLVADSSTSTGLRYTAGNPIPNPVLNSAFQIWQRGTSIAGSGNNYLADRWQNFTTTGGRTYSRQATNDTTNLPNIQYCMRVQRDSGNAFTGVPNIYQSMETVNSIPYAGKTVTFSFYARAGANFSATSNALSVYFASGTGTDQNLATAGYTGQTALINQNVTLTSTWQRFSLSATVGATATELGMSFNYVPTGTAGAADFFEITGVQLDIGSVALPFRTNGATIQGELSACQRYYQRISGSSIQIATGMAESTPDVVFPVASRVQLRVAATAIDFSAPVMYNGVTTFSGGSMLLRYGSPNILGCMYRHPTGVFTAGTNWILFTDTNGFVGFSAEL
jgi:hypothetical protein